MGLIHSDCLSGSDEATNFTFSDYAKALKNAGPKTAENILYRARIDSGISFFTYMLLEDMADRAAAKWKGRPADETL